MKKKITIIAIFIILLVIIGFLITEKQHNEQKIQLGHSSFEIPNGFHEGNINSLGSINLTNGTNSIFLTNYNQSTMDEQFKEVRTYFDRVNESYNTTNLTSSQTNIYKLTLQNKTESYYWFEKNNEVYYIYNWDGIKNMDEIVFDLIKTMS